MIVIFDGPGADSRYLCARALAARLRGGTVEGRARLDTCVDALAPLAAQVAGLGGAQPVVLSGFLLDWAAARPWQGYQGTSSALNRALAVTRLAARQGAIRVVSIAKKLPAVDRAACETLNAAVSRIIPTYYDTRSWSELRRLDLTKVHDFVRHHQNKEMPLLPFTAGVGPTRPAAILVGDAPAYEAWNGIPFGDGKASTWLNRTLLVHGPADLGLYLLDSTEDPLAELLSVRRRAKGCPVIAMGVDAAHWLRRCGIPHHRLRHPMHMQGFHSGQTAAWGAKLVKIQEGRPDVRGQAT